MSTLGDASTISRHIANVFDEEELEEESNLQKMQISSSDEPFMGLSTFSGNQATKKDIGVANNYLQKVSCRI